MSCEGENLEIMEIEALKESWRFHLWKGIGDMKRNLGGELPVKSDITGNPDMQTVKVIHEIYSRRFGNEAATVFVAGAVRDYRRDINE